MFEVHLDYSRLKKITLSLFLLPIKMLGLHVFPWSNLWARKIWSIRALKEKPPVYVGDKIATSAIGKFTKRSDYNFIFVR